MDLKRNSLGVGDKPALVVVDVINGFTDASCALGCDCPDVVAANATLLAEFHRRQLPVFFTTVVYHGDDQARVFRERINALNVLTPDSHWVHVDPRLEVGPQDVLIEKQWASIFHSTEMDERMRAAGFDSLVFTGLTTCGCVRATFVDGMQYEYRFVVARESVGDRNPEAHEANLFDMHAKYADVMSVQDIIAGLPREGA